MSQNVISAGIDVGSSAIKVAVFESPAGSGRRREGAKIIGLANDRIRRRTTNVVVADVYGQALENAGIGREQVDYVATTGEGEGVEFRTGHFYGMTTHSRGAVFLDPEARSAVDVGALHARAIRFDQEAKVEGYRMTSQCASGSGQFLENIARYLGVTLDEVGVLSKSAEDPERVSSICAVLAETDVINMVSRGISLPNILKGIHESMAGRLAKLLRMMKVKTGVVLITGGLAADEGLTACLAEAMQKLKLGEVEIRTHKDSVYAGAIGAAYTLDELQRSKYFKGVRHIWEGEDDPGWIVNSGAIVGLKELVRRKLTFDFLAKPANLPFIPQVMDQVPDLRAVVDHIAKPLIADHVVEPWLSDMRKVASINGMHCKISGMVTEADQQNWTVDDLRPYVHHVLGMFGADRLMFGTDWPVSTLAAEYKSVAEATREILKSLSPDAKSDIFGATATRFYSLGI